MTEAAVQVVFIYYSTMWVLNVAAYAVRVMALYRWKEFVQGMFAENVLDLALRIAATFGIARLIAGLTGVALYQSGQITIIETILWLGVTSLFLNTTFIMSEGFLLYSDAHKVRKLPKESQDLVRQAADVFTTLRRTANAK